jgi:FkbM family methyltransferase
MIRKTKEGVWVVDNDTHFTKWVEEHKRLDTDHGFVINLIKPYVNKNQAVLDLGANIGTQTITYANYFGPENVIAIEPNPECVECLRKNIPDCTVIKAAVSDEFSDKSLFLQDNVGASYITEGQGVKTIRLDDCQPFLNSIVNNKKFTFIKIDVEGYEIKALQGAKNFISKHKPVMVIEINEITLNRYGYNQNQLLNEIKTLGYNYQPYTEVGVQYDVLCLPI